MIKEKDKKMGFLAVLGFDPQYALKID